MTKTFQRYRYHTGYDMHGEETFGTFTVVEGTNLAPIRKELGKITLLETFQAEVKE